MYLISKFIGNEIVFVRSYKKIRRGYAICFTKQSENAQMFADKQTAKLEAEALQVATGKVFFVERLSAAAMDSI